MIIHGIKSKSYTRTFFDYNLLLIITTVESLKFVETQFSWYSRVLPQRIYILDENKFGKS